MQEAYISAPRPHLRHNTPSAVRFRITGQYLILYLLAFLLGIILCSLLDPAALPPIGRFARAHFDTLFAGCSTIHDAVSVIMDSASGDIRAMMLILTFGLTMFCPPALCALTAWRGFSLGFTTAALSTAISDGRAQIPHAGAAFVFFLSANVLIAAAFVRLSAEAVLFSHQYREICGRPRKIIRAPFVRRYLFVYLTMFGFVMLVHTAYCLLSFWLI